MVDLLLPVPSKGFAYLRNVADILGQEVLIFCLIWEDSEDDLLHKDGSMMNRRAALLREASNYHSIWRMTIRLAKALNIDLAKYKEPFMKARQLSALDPEIAKVMSESGDGDKHKVQVSKGSYDAIKLKPSQTTMVLDMSVEIALDMLKNEDDSPDLGAILSKDGYIMDGHHRWSGAVLAWGKDARVGAYQASLKGPQLLSVLNILTKGYLGRNKGQNGEGDLAAYTPANVRKKLDKAVKDGVGGKHPKSASEVKAILSEAFGSVEGGIEAISNNAKHITTTVPSWAPDRSDMPVIRKDEVADVAKKLQRGDVLIF